MAHQFRWFFMPYCLLRQPDGSYVITNRRYKPLGMTSASHVVYEDHPVRVRFVRQLSAATIGALDCKGRTDPERIYLYNDGCVPTSSDAAWTAYSARLKRLAALQVVPLEE